MSKLTWTVLVLWFSLQAFTIGLSHEPGDQPGPAPVAVAGTDPGAAPDGRTPSTVEGARRQAEVLHAALHHTLQLVHQRYYRENEGLPLPAAIMGEVFAELEKEQHIELRWLAVEGQAMNADHQPQDQFEIDAASALKSGKREFELVEVGVYRRVGAITLNSQCLKCHVPNRKNLEDRTAGLSIAIPVRDQ